jgi:hypothetical protein
MLLSIRSVVEVERSIVDSPVEVQVVIDHTGREVARTWGDGWMFPASTTANYIESTVLHNHVEWNIWFFSAGDYLFAEYHNVKTMIVVNRLDRYNYKRCTMTRLGNIWRPQYDFKTLERKLEVVGWHQYWTAWAIESNIAYHCENVSYNISK